MESFYNYDKASAVPVNDQMAISLGNAASHQCLLWSMAIQKEQEYLSKSQLVRFYHLHEVSLRLSFWTQNKETRKRKVEICPNTFLMRFPGMRFARWERWVYFWDLPLSSSWTYVVHEHLFLPLPLLPNRVVKNT